MYAKPAKGVSPHDGDDLLPGETEVVLEELNSLPPITHDIRVDLGLLGDVGPDSVLNILWICSIILYDSNS